MACPHIVRNLFASAIKSEFFAQLDFRTFRGYSARTTPGSQFQNPACRSRTIRYLACVHNRGWAIGPRCFTHSL
jgi:hypothetical protein